MIFERRNISISMEAVMLRGSMDRTISPYKSHMRDPINNNPFFVYENLVPSNFQNMGLLQAPPLLSHSYPPYSFQQPQQPPLLPLPTTNGHHNAALSRVLSCPPPTKKTHNSNRTRDPSLTPKKSRSPTKCPKKQGKFSPKKSSESVIVPSTSPLGPDPKELPKVLPSITSTGSVYSNANVNSGMKKKSLSSLKEVEDKIDVFSGSVVFTISPPPSSLPLPTFSLRPKLSCNVEAAAGIDTGATDNLRRLLRLL